MLAMAFLATLTAVVSTGKVNAGTDSTKKVQVVIADYNGWVNTCTLENYEFTFDAWTQDQTDTISHMIECKFWDASVKTVQLQLQDDLSNGSTSIAKEHVTLSNTAWSYTPNDIAWSDTYVFQNQPFYASWGKSLFTKIENKIWDATWANVDITVTVPAWTPNGTYTGTLVLTF